MNPISNAIRSFLIKELTTLASDTADKAKQNASWSSKIPNAISVGSVQDSGDGRVFIDIIVDARRDGPAPHATAFEYGSGIHKKEGAKEYRIPKEGKSGVAFPKERWPGYSPPPPAPDVFIFEHVMHPGVKAKPYLKPAIESTKKTIRGRFLRAFKMGYIEAVPRVTIIEVK